jgi:hypothetical protein
MHKWRLYVCVVLILLLAVAMLSLRNIGRQGSLTLNRIAVHRIRSVLILVKSIYIDTGRIFSSIDEIASSGYFPYSKDSYSRFTVGEDAFVIEYSNIVTETKIESTGYMELNKNRNQLLTHSTEVLPSGESTKLRIRLYLSGLLSYTRKIIEYREEINSVYQGEADSYNVGMFPGSNLPVLPYNKEFPKNSNELAQYVAYVELVENQAPLRDEWGNALHFYICDQYLFCRSPGCDGILQTNDDIVDVSGIGNR